MQSRLPPAQPRGACFRLENERNPVVQVRHGRCPWIANIRRTPPALPACRERQWGAIRPGYGVRLRAVEDGPPFIRASTTAIACLLAIADLQMLAAAAVSDVR